jgi:hypothetical protein
VVRPAAAGAGARTAALSKPLRDLLHGEPEQLTRLHGTRVTETHPLRRLHPGDAVEYRRLMLDAYGLHPDAFTSSAAERGVLPISWWESRLRLGDDVPDAVFGAFVENTLLGVAGVGFESRAASGRSAWSPSRFAWARSSSRSSTCGAASRDSGSEPDAAPDRAPSVSSVRGWRPPREIGWSPPGSATSCPRPWPRRGDAGHDDPRRRRYL